MTDDERATPPGPQNDELRCEKESADEGDAGKRPEEARRKSLGKKSVENKCDDENGSSPLPANRS